MIYNVAIISAVQQSDSIKSHKHTHTYHIISMMVYHKILNIVPCAIHFCLWCCSVAKSCPTLTDPMDCSPPGSSVCWFSQARILEQVTIPFFRGSSWPRDRAWVSCIARGFFTPVPLSISSTYNSWYLIPNSPPKLLCLGNHKPILYVCKSVYVS